MGLYFGGLLVSAGFLAYAVYLRICYFKHQAVCLDCLYGTKSFITRPLYEYELIVAGKKRTYTNRGTTIFYPRKGKRYKVLICKRDYNKVVGYAEYVVDLCMGGFLFAVITVVLILFY